MTGPLLLGVREAAAALGLGRDSTYSLVRTGRLRAVVVGRSIKIPRSELEAFVSRELQNGGDAIPSATRNLDVNAPGSIRNRDAMVKPHY